jgi:hypothetical protein
LSAIFGLTAIVAVALSVLSFVVARRAEPHWVWRAYAD